MFSFSIILIVIMVLLIETNSYIITIEFKMSFTDHNEDDFIPPPPKRIASGSSEGSRRSAVSSKSTNGNVPKIEESPTLHCSLTLPEPMQYPPIRERGYYSDIVSQDAAVQKHVSLIYFLDTSLSLMYALI